MAKKQVNQNQDINQIIRQAVKEAIEAIKPQVNFNLNEKKAFQQTERRLRALPDIREKIEIDKDRLEHGIYGEPGRSGDIIFFKRSGMRLDDEEVQKAWEQDLKATIAANQREIDIMTVAMDPLITDPYWQVIPYKYWEGLTDDEIADHMMCDASTVRRNKSRIVRRLAVRLFGVDAL